MKTFIPAAVAASLLLATISESAPVSAGVLDPYMATEISDINDIVRETNSRVEKILTHIEQQDKEAYKGACWLDGKAFSQGAEAKVGNHVARCSVQPGTGWPQWNGDSLVVD
ncbi:hypothetical protein [Pantoea sp. DY-5]|uniref:hypothetical protein n=1 Tax=Pantoea sp. DY-5 TaxID=2871488 RepID=UPI001C937E6D|nr:hypothetical protein [Pantoea sp. DY-5]MBY4841263.1 hypothetical protein [Pantoea sp. DY-5]